MTRGESEMGLAPALYSCITSAEMISLSLIKAVYERIVTWV
jgi:hypothetical protein